MTYFFLVSPETVDEELIDAIRAKKNLSDIITDGEFSRDAFLSRRGMGRGSQFELDFDDLHAPR